MLVVANFAITKWCKKNLKNDSNPVKWVLILEHLAKAIQWIPTCLGIGRVKTSLLMIIMIIDIWYSTLSTYYVQKRFSLRLIKIFSLDCDDKNKNE